MVYKQMKMTFMDYNRALFRKWWLILPLASLGILITFCLTQYVIKPTYEAHSTVYIQQAPEASLNYDADQLLRTWQVQGEALQNLNHVISPEELIKGLDVMIVHRTSFIYIGFKHHDPLIAMKVANALAEALVSKTSAFRVSERIQIIEPAEIPEVPINFDLWSNIILEITFVWILSLLVLHCKLTFKAQNYDVEEDTHHFELPVVGTVTVLRERW